MSSFCCQLLRVCAAQHLLRMLQLRLQRSQVKQLLIKLSLQLLESLK
jgi:hypothetical protein